MAEAGPYELLLGRGTYEIFAAHWPYDEGPIADHLNGTRKHVASTTLDRVEWNNSTLIAGDVAEYVAALQARGRPGDPGPRQPRPDPDAARSTTSSTSTACGSSRSCSAAASASSATGTIPAALKLRRQHGLEDRRDDQHLRARRRRRHRVVRVRGADARRSSSGAAASRRAKHWRRSFGLRSRPNEERPAPRNRAAVLASAGMAFMTSGHSGGRRG